MPEAEIREALADIEYRIECLYEAAGQCGCSQCFDKYEVQALEEERDALEALLVQVSGS